MIAAASWLPNNGNCARSSFCSVLAMLKLFSATAAETDDATDGEEQLMRKVAKALEISCSCTTVTAPAGSIDNFVETSCCCATVLRNRNGTTPVSIVCIESPAASCARARELGDASDMLMKNDVDAGAGAAAHSSCSDASMCNVSLVPTT